MNQFPNINENKQNQSAFKFQEAFQQKIQEPNFKFQQQNTNETVYYSAQGDSDHIDDNFRKNEFNSQNSNNENIDCIQENQTLEKLKKQCWDRIRSKRKSILLERRIQSVQRHQNENYSKKLQEEDSKQVNDELARDQYFMDQIFNAEFEHLNRNYDDVDYLNHQIENYENLKNEVENYLIQQLNDESQWDHQLWYEREEQFYQSNLNLQQQAYGLQNPNEKKGIFTCALCKSGFVHRINLFKIQSKMKNRVNQTEDLKQVQVRIACENIGCLDVLIQVPIDGKKEDPELAFKRVDVEELMNTIHLSILDHKKIIDQQENQGNQICTEKDVKVETTEINDDSDVDMDGENDQIQNQIDQKKSNRVQTFVISCKKCDFYDLCPYQIE